MGGGREEEGGKVSKVYEKESAFYSSWFNLEHNLELKLFAQPLSRLQVKKQ